MVNEWLMIYVMASTGILFAVGGTGFKWARRFVLPLNLAAIGLICHEPAWRLACFAVSLIVALCLPYGERTAYWLKAIVFCMYGLPFLWLGWTWWIIMVPVGMMLMFVLSNWKYTADIFFWKGVEFMWGLMLALAFIGVVNG